MLAITFAPVARMDRHPAVAARQLRRIARSPSAIVYLLARARHRGLSTNVLLLAGVTMNAFFSALILFVQYFADFARDVPDSALADGRSRRQQLPAHLTALPLVVVAFAAFAWLARPLNLLSLGPGAAETRGLDVVRAQRAAFLSASLATGAAVSVGGPDRLHRHHRAASGPADGRCGSSGRASGIGAFRRGVPRRLRRARANGDGADGAPGGSDHGAHRRAVLSVAACEEDVSRRARDSRRQPGSRRTDVSERRRPKTA